MSSLIWLILFSTHAHDSRNWIESNSGYCFSQHLKEAIVVNLARAKTYDLLTQGRSKKISHTLLAFDYLGKPFARYFDERSKNILGSHGYPLICEVIPSMLPTLERKTRITKKTAISKFSQPWASSFVSRITEAHRENGLTQVLHIMQKLKIQLAQTPEFNCLTRHYIVSVERLIEASLHSPSKDAEALAWDLIRITLLQLKVFTTIDQMAAPLQAEGIPILCNEVPELPTL